MAKTTKAFFITTGLVTKNRRANFDYEISTIYIAGLELQGTEVKSLRMGKVNIADGYGIEKDGEIYMSNLSISEYAFKGYQTHDERRDRKLLLSKKQIKEIIGELSKKGSTLVPMRLFFNEKGRAKLEVGIGRGKKLYDKRETEKQRDWTRDKQRIMIDANR